MNLKVYEDKEDALNDIPRLELEVLPCLEMVMDDVFTLDLYYPLGFKSDNPDPIGKINVKFSFSSMRPMISVGDWVMSYFIDAEIIDFKLNNMFKSNKNDIIKLFSMALNVENKKLISYSPYTPFARSFYDEIQFFKRMCSINGQLNLNDIIWDI